MASGKIAGALNAAVNDIKRIGTMQDGDLIAIRIGQETVKIERCQGYFFFDGDCVGTLSQALVEYGNIASTVLES